MMNRFAWAGSALMMFSLLGSGTALAQDESGIFDNRWYLGLMGGVARPGKDRMTDSTTGYYGASAGRFLSPDFSLDLQIDTYDADFNGSAGVPANTSDNFNIDAFGLTGRYHLGEAEQVHRPYGLIGLGVQKHESFLDDGRDMYVSWGAGIQSKLGDNFRLRTQIEGRYDNDRESLDSDNGFVDMIVSVGLTYSFGELPRPPVPAPAPEPVAAPAPPPPPPAPAPRPEPEVIFEFDSTVTFGFDSAVIRPEAEAELNRAASILRQRDEIILLEVAGHTDSIGSEEYNRDLSQRRAQSVADYLEGRGIARERMRVVGFGESRPKVPNTPPENRQMNRRVVLSILERRNR